MHCPVTGINIPRFLLSIIIGFIFVFGFDYLVHENLLMDLYEQTASLWRPVESMEEFFPLMIARTLLLVAIPGYIYTRNHEGKGIGEGIRFGVIIGLFVGIGWAGMIAYMPIPVTLAGAWFAASFIQMVGLGFLFSLIYKN